MTINLDWRTPPAGIAIIAACFILAATYFIITGGDSWYTTYVCPWFLPVGIGLWLKHQWARWVAFTFFCLVSLGLIVSLFQHGFSIKGVLRCIVVTGSLLPLWEWEVSPTDNSEFPDEPVDQVD